MHPRTGFLEADVFGRQPLHVQFKERAWGRTSFWNFHWCGMRGQAQNSARGFGRFG